MKILLFLALVLSTTVVSARTLDCTAIYRTVIGRNSIEKAVEMPVTLELNGLVQYSIDFEGRHFSVSEEAGQSHLVQITQPPDYTIGMVLRASPDSSGRLHLAEVNGFTVHKIECRQR